MDIEDILILDIGYSSLDIEDLEIFGDWILEISEMWRFGYSRFRDLPKIYIFLM